MFQKILVPVDLADRHQRALDIAARLAQQAGGEITLLHVIELIQGLPMEEEKNFYQRLEKKARIQLERFQAPLLEQKLNPHVKVLFGDRAVEIIRYAVQSAADLIVVSSHKVDVDNPGGGWGTLSYKLSILSQCPVLLVK